MLFIIILFLARAMQAQWVNSKAQSRISLAMLGFGFLFLNKNWFLLFQTNQIANKKA
ncbi:hypothetical protein ACB094_03G038400 [Castanea mollissima]